MRRIGAMLLALLWGCAGADVATDVATDTGAGQDTGGPGVDTSPVDADGAGGADVSDSSATDVPDSADAGGGPASDTAVADTTAEPDAGSVPDSTDAPDADVGPTDPPLPTELAGRIHVIQNVEAGVPSNGYVLVDLRDGPLPTSQVVEKEEGDCKVLVGALNQPWMCTPECAPGLELCVEGACLPYPNVASSGLLTIGGLVTPLTLEPDAQWGYSAVYDLPAPLFDPGAAVTATSTGGATPALDLAAEGVAPLDADPSGWTFTPGEDYTVTWVPDAGGARIQLLVQTGWHGSPNLSTIWCETDDDGELVVPAALTEGFPIPGCGKCQASYLSRFTRDVVDHGHGPIELFVASQVQFIAWWGGL